MWPLLSWAMAVILLFDRLEEVTLSDVVCAKAATQPIEASAAMMSFLICGQSIMLKVTK